MTCPVTTTGMQVVVVVSTDSRGVLSEPVYQCWKLQSTTCSNNVFCESNIDAVCLHGYNNVDAHNEHCIAKLCVSLWNSANIKPVDGALSVQHYW